MKKTVFIITLAVVLILVGYFIYNRSKQSPGKVTPIIDESKMYDVPVETWIRENAGTYRYDGSGLALQNKQPCQNEPGCEQFVFSFDSAHGGYGDRRDVVVTQVITPHRLIVLLKNGSVVSAITDGKFDEIRQMTLTTSTPTTTTRINLKIYLGNSLRDPTASCDMVFPVVRTIEQTQTPGRRALEELLKGPTAEEKNEKYFTSIPSGVRVKSLTIINGVARADFSPELDKGVGGSCRVVNIRKQIEETLKQFPTVSQVIISINGNTDEILQP